MRLFFDVFFQDELERVKNVLKPHVNIIIDTINELILHFERLLGHVLLLILLSQLMSDIMQSCLHDATVLGYVVLTSHSVLEHHSHQMGSVLGTYHLEVAYGDLFLHVHSNPGDNVVDVSVLFLEVHQRLDIQIL